MREKEKRGVWREEKLRGVLCIRICERYIERMNNNYDEEKFA